MKIRCKLRQIRQINVTANIKHPLDRNRCVTVDDEFLSFNLNQKVMQI